MNLYLGDYINSRDSLHKIEFSYQEHNKGVLYGLNFYDYVIENICIEKKSIDIRPFHILYNHKRLMKIRLEYLFSRNIYDNDEISRLLLQNDELINKSKLIRNLAIKYSIRNNTETIESIKDKCKMLKNLDYVLISQILKCTK